MKEFKFKIGDRVRIIKGNNGSMRVGGIETIKGIVIKTTEMIREFHPMKTTKVYYLLRYDHQFGNKFTEGQLEKVEE